MIILNPRERNNLIFFNFEFCFLIEESVISEKNRDISVKVFRIV